MTCDDLLKAINGYIDGEIDPSVCDLLRDHLNGCDACQVVVDTLRKTVHLYRDAARVEEVPLPGALRQRLTERLRAAWQGGRVGGVGGGGG